MPDCDLSKFGGARQTADQRLGRDASATRPLVQESGAVGILSQAGIDERQDGGERRQQRAETGGEAALSEHSFRIEPDLRAGQSGR